MDGGVFQKTRSSSSSERRGGVWGTLRPLNCPNEILVLRKSANPLQLIPKSINKGSFVLIPVWH